MRPAILDRLLENMTNMHELGRQLAFERDRPFYGMYKEDGGYYRKEMPSGEKYLVTIEVFFDEFDRAWRINDTVIKEL